MLDGGRAGVLVARGEVRGLREALGALLDDDERRRAIAAAARERCEANYDARRQFARLVEIFAGLSSSGRPSQ
jgi:glycosyltransferase involved in cell wall biosynthesis